MEKFIFALTILFALNGKAQERNTDITVPKYICYVKKNQQLLSYLKITANGTVKDFDSSSGSATLVIDELSSIEIDIRKTPEITNVSLVNIKKPTKNFKAGWVTDQAMMTFKGVFIDSIFTLKGDHLFVRCISSESKDWLEISKDAEKFTLAN
jgi:hypothetical protein